MKKFLQLTIITLGTFFLVDSIASRVWKKRTALILPIFCWALPKKRALYHWATGTDILQFYWNTSSSSAPDHPLKDRLHNVFTEKGICLNQVMQLPKPMQVFDPYSICSSCSHYFHILTRGNIDRTTMHFTYQKNTCRSKPCRSLVSLHTQDSSTSIYINLLANTM